MKIYRFFLLFLVFSCVLISCTPNNKYEEQVRSLEVGVEDPSSEAEILAAIKAYEVQLDEIIEVADQTGMWYKILGVRYMDKGMYAKALDAFQSAIPFYPNNQNLYYYVGICAGYMANAQLDYVMGESSAGRDAYLALAESAYVRAIELDASYANALYGLGVLYVREMGRSAEAIAYLERLLASDSGHFDAMFVLAEAYYVNFYFQKAVDIYDGIIANAKVSLIILDAEKNKKVVLDALYSQ